MALATTPDPAYLDATTAKKVAILNARVGATLLNDKLDVAVFGSNLTNRQDLISSLQLSAPIALVNGITHPPRQYGITAAFKF